MAVVAPFFFGRAMQGKSGVAGGRLAMRNSHAKRRRLARAECLLRETSPQKPVRVAVLLGQNQLAEARDAQRVDRAVVADGHGILAGKELLGSHHPRVTDGRRNIPHGFGCR